MKYPFEPRVRRCRTLLIFALSALTVLAVASPAAAVCEARSKSPCKAKAGKSGGKARKAIVLAFHGGGFVIGRTRDVGSHITALRARGVAAKAAPYPLGQGGHAAFYSALRQARRYRSRGYRVYASGFSAGATMALWLAALGEVRGAVTWGGPTDFLRWGTPGSVEARLLAPFAWWPGREAAIGRAHTRRRLSPLLRLSRRSARTVLYHASDDRIAPVDHAERFVRRARRYHVQSRLATYPSGGHVGYLWVQRAMARRLARMVGAGR